MRYKSGDLLGYAVLMLTLHLNGRVEGGGVCKDSQGHTYNTGFLYIPEPCTVCVCDNGSPKWCKAVICTLSQKPMPKQDCKSFRIDGTPCCEFICLDDTISSGTNDKIDSIENSSSTNANYDLELRLVAGCFTAILSLSLLFFLIHRFRQRKIRVCAAGRQNRQLTDEQRTLGNMGYLERGGLPHGVQMDDLACSGGYPLWKPPGNYFPRGEAPPPYEEAVAAARAEQALLSIQSHATLSPLNLQNTFHTIHPTVTLVNGMQNTLTPNSPSPSNNIIPSPSSSSSCGTSRQLSQINSHCHQQQQQQQQQIHQQIQIQQQQQQHQQQQHQQQIDNNNLSNSVGNYYNNTIVNKNYNVGTSTYENLPGPITLSNITTPQQHTTVNNHFNNPNNNTNNINTNNNNSNNNITNNTNNNNSNNNNSSSSSNNNNINNNTNNCHQLPSTISNNINSKNYHTTLPRQGSAFTISSNTGISTHRTIPRTLATSNHLRLRRDLSINQPVLCDTTKINNISSTINKLPNSAPPIVSTNKLLQKKFNIDTLKDFKFNHSINKDNNYCKIEAGPSNINTGIKNICDKKPPPLLSRAGTNQDESFDSVTCHCSMQALPTMHDDADDYRSECENCKSATGSRYYLDNEDELVTSPHETMTLHRRPEETTASVTPQYYRTSLTLPTSTRQRSRSTGGRNWFSSMPESSTESSDDD